MNSEAEHFLRNLLECNVWALNGPSPEIFTLYLLYYGDESAASVYILNIFKHIYMTYRNMFLPFYYELKFKL